MKINPIKIPLDWDVDSGSFQGDLDISVDNYLISFFVSITVECIRQTPLDYDSPPEEKCTEEIYVDNIRIWNEDGETIELPTEDLEQDLTEAIIWE